MAFRQYAEKFVYTGGDWREFRGYVFQKGKPVTVVDEATIIALKAAHDFKHIEEVEFPDAITQDAPPPPKPLESRIRGILHIRKRT